MGTLLHSCAEVREPIELSSGVVSVVSPGIYVLDGGDLLQKEGERVREVSGIFSPVNVNGALFSRNVLDSCVKHTHTHTTILQLSGFCLGQQG